MHTLLIIWILSSALLWAQESTTKLPYEKSLHSDILPNGLHYTIVHNAKPKDKAELRLLVHAGSLEEQDDQRGIAHYIEHMAFNGTKHFPKNALIHYLESIGTTFGSDLNANTGFERTLYKLTIPLEGDQLQKALLVMRDWADGLRLDPIEFDKERGVILEEARLHNNVGKRLFETYQKLFFSQSRFIERDPIGSIESIKHLSVARAKDFYQQWYRPELMHLIVVGDINATEVEQRVCDQFGSLVNHTHTPRHSRIIPENNQTRIGFFSDPEITSNSLQINYIEQVDPLHTVRDKREGLIESILYALINEKAKEQLRKPHPKAMALGLSSTRLSSLRGGYLFYANYREGDGLAALEELYTLLYSFEQYGFEREAFDAIIKQMHADNEKSHQRLSDLRSAAITAKLLSTIQGDSVYVDYGYSYAITKKLLSEISAEEVHRYFQKMMQIPDRALFFVTTDGQRYSMDEIREVWKNAREKAKAFTQHRQHAKQLLDKLPTPTTIQSKSHDSQTGIYHYQLNNGITIDFKPTDFSKNTVLLRGLSWGGFSLVSDSNLSAVQKAAGWVDSSAPADFTPAELRLLLAGKRVSLRSTISRFTEGIGGSASSEDIQALFALLHLKLTQPKIDPLISHNAKETLKSTIAKSSRDPRYRFSKEMTQFYFSHHPRIQFDTPERIDALDEESMLMLYRERFSDLNHFHFVLVGDSNTSIIEPLITQYLGSVPTAKTDEYFRDRHYDYLTGYQQFIRHYSHDNIANVSLLYRSHLGYSQKNAIGMVLMLDILNIRLRNLIREEKSGVYSIHAGGRISRELKNRALSTISFSCDPDRRTELTNAIKQEIAKLQREGVTAQELTTIQKKYLLAHKTNLKSNHYWIGKILDAHRYHTPMRDILSVDERIKQISTQEIQTIAQRVYDHDLLESALLPTKHNSSTEMPK
jgi:zinc protease